MVRDPIDTPGGAVFASSLVANTSVGRAVRPPLGSRPRRGQRPEREGSGDRGCVALLVLSPGRGKRPGTGPGGSSPSALAARALRSRAFSDALRLQLRLVLVRLRRLRQRGRPRSDRRLRDGKSRLRFYH
jgi:hypothetical protein